MAGGNVEDRIYGTGDLGTGAGLRHGEGHHGFGVSEPDGVLRRNGTLRIRGGASRADSVGEVEEGGVHERRVKELDALAQRRSVTGIGPRRAEIILPGAAVLSAVLHQFRIPHLAYCSAGVRDGILRDLAERGVGAERIRLDKEQRLLTENFARRFGVDLKHARKVAIFARELFLALESLHRLPPEQGRLLEAAAYLRDTGHAINDMGHHKHSQYIVANSDLAGFTDSERSEVAMLCRYHRKAPPSARHADFISLPLDRQRVVTLLSAILRLADALDRSRDQRVSSISCAVTPNGFALTLSASSDVSLERWALERAAPHFRLVFERQLSIATAP